MSTVEDTTKPAPSAQELAEYLCSSLVATYFLGSDLLSSLEERNINTNIIKSRVIDDVGENFWLYPICSVTPGQVRKDLAYAEKSKPAKYRTTKWSPKDFQTAWSHAKAKGMIQTWGAGKYGTSFTVLGNSELYSYVNNYIDIMRDDLQVAINERIASALKLIQSVPTSNPVFVSDGIIGVEALKSLRDLKYEQKKEAKILRAVHVNKTYTETVKSSLANMSALKQAVATDLSQANKTIAELESDIETLKSKGNSGSSIAHIVSWS